MAEIKHTPDKWHYTGYADHCGVGRKYHEIVDDDGFEIVNQNGIVTSDHDAQIMSASPELLAITQELFTLLEEHEGEAKWYLRGHYNRARAAIDKATKGESPR